MRHTVKLAVLCVGCIPGLFGSIGRADEPQDTGIRGSYSSSVWTDNDVRQSVVPPQATFTVPPGLSPWAINYSKQSPASVAPTAAVGSVTVCDDSGTPVQSGFPLMLQVGPPPNSYSPSADFAARVSSSDAPTATDQVPTQAHKMTIEEFMSLRQPISTAANPPGFIPAPPSFELHAVAPNYGSQFAPVYILSGTPPFSPPHAATPMIPHVGYFAAGDQMPPPPPMPPVPYPTATAPAYVVASNNHLHDMLATTCEGPGCVCGCDACPASAFAGNLPTACTPMSYGTAYAPVAFPAPPMHPALMYPPGVLPSPAAAQAAAADCCPTSGVADRLDHILQAAHHLDEAGLSEKADELRRQCDQDVNAVIAALKSSQAELAGMRQASFEKTESDFQRMVAEKSPNDDHVKKMVVVHVEMVEINRSKMRNLGFDFDTADETGVKSASLSSLLTQNSANCDCKSCGGSAFNVLQPGSALPLLLQSLEKDGIATVLSRPTIATQNGETGVIQVGEQVPMLASNGSIVKIEYRTVGTELEVKPIILAGDEIQLRLRHRVTQRRDGTQADEATSADNIETREVESGIKLKSGQTAVLGGLVERRIVHAKAFRRESEEITNGETIVRGIPADIQEEQEFETLLIVRPEIADGRLKSKFVAPELNNLHAAPAVEQSSDAGCDHEACEHCEHQTADWLPKLELPVAQPSEGVSKFRNVGIGIPNRQVMLTVQTVEVDMTKLKASGFKLGQDDFSKCIAATGKPGPFRFTVSGDVKSIEETVTGLQHENLMQVLSDPTLTTVSGRSAHFHSGGEFPILVPTSDGATSIDFKKFGTEIDFTPIVDFERNIHLEVRPRITQIDENRSVTINGTTVPGLRVREVDTGADMRSGQVLIIGGLVQTLASSNETWWRQVTNSSNCDPKVSDLLRAFGTACGLDSGEDAKTPETALFFLIRPEIVEPQSNQVRPVDYQSVDKPKNLDSGNPPHPGDETIDAFAEELPVGCTSHCDSCSTTNVFTDRVFNTSFWSEALSAGPVWLETGKMFDHMATPQPYEIDPATFNKFDQQTIEHFMFGGIEVGR